jgi:putative Holliday junction resolvase
MALTSRDSDSPATSREKGRVLAIDYGRRRIGLALSDERRMTARPLATLERTNRRNDLRRLRELARRHEVRQIVVGWPLHLDGAAGEMAEEAARFARRIEKELGLPVELVDERLTSWAAQDAARERRRSGGKRGASVDALAAALILEDYLEGPSPRRVTKH